MPSKIIYKVCRYVNKGDTYQINGLPDKIKRFNKAVEKGMVPDHLKDHIYNNILKLKNDE